MSAPQPRDPNKNFNQDELKSIQLAISLLEEYMTGYTHIERWRRFERVEMDTPLDRFFETALIAILDGFYPASRSQGLLPVLRLVNCNALANEIEAALDRKIGSTTWAAIANVIRDRTIAHPRFTKDAMMPVVENWQRHLQSQEDIDAFQEATFTVRHSTAAVFFWFKKRYPELTAYSISDKGPPPPPVDNSPPSES